MQQKQQHPRSGDRDGAAADVEEGIEGQQQQPPSGDHDRAAANMEDGLERQKAVGKYYNELQRAAVQGKWETAETILKRLSELDVNKMIHPQFVRIHITIATISIAGGSRTIDFLKKLVKYLPDESLFEKANDLGLNLLHYAGMMGNKAAARVLVERAPELLNVTNDDLPLPAYMAASFSQKETFEYLRCISTSDVARSHFNDPVRQLQVFNRATDAEYFDIALDMLGKCPEIATVKTLEGTQTLERISALRHMAQVASKYSASSGHFSNSWECFLHLGSRIPHIKSINDKHLKRQKIFELVKRLCNLVESLCPREEASEMYSDAIFAAAGFGSHEVVEVIAETRPQSIMYTDTKSRNIFHLATEHRHNNVFNLIYRIGGFSQLCQQGKDLDGNNILHVAAKLAPPRKLNQISGAALQMQYEIQWYKEVEELLSPANRHIENRAGKTPATLFTKNHRKLKDAGEKWMKQIAKSCSIVAALIITIMFTAMITVPGEDYKNSGSPIFQGEKAFIVFAIADAISLFTSSTSLLIFLSILTSRFPEESFLCYHPTQLIFGLGTLFFSIASMMVAFAVITFLVLGRKKAWILIPTTAFASLGVASFAFLQFPLLCSLIFSTYGQGMFNKNSRKPLL